MIKWLRKIFCKCDSKLTIPYNHVLLRHSITNEEKLFEYTRDGIHQAIMLGFNYIVGIHVVYNNGSFTYFVETVVAAQRQILDEEELNNYLK